MAGKFRFRGLAEITHINARKEGPDDDKELAVDVKFSASKVPAWILDLLGDDLVGLLFLPGSQAVRNPMLGPLTFAHEIEDYRLEILGGIHHGCRVKKITATPADGEVVTLTFGVSFKPSGDEVARMAEYLQDAVEIDLGPASAELELGMDESEGVTLIPDDRGPGRGSPHVYDNDQYEQAKAAVIAEQRASISFVQRTLRIGYNAAARMIERMEADGVVSATNANGAREVLARAAA